MRQTTTNKQGRQLSSYVFLEQGKAVSLLEQRIQVGTNAPIVMEYGYDRLGRIQMVKDSIVTGCGNPGWSQFFAYDRWGNRAMVTGSCGDLGIEVAPVVPATAATQTMAQRALAVEGHFPNNRWADGAGGARHDASGNVVRASGNTFFYDGEGHQTLANAGGWTWKYRYNGEGRRVGMEKWGQTGMVESRHFVYDPGGNLIAELAGTAVQGGWSPKYFGSDYLGSTRIVLNNTGTNDALVSSRHDYFPFGDEVPNRGGQFGDTSVKVKFTGKERDAETGLDYFGARYFSGAQGRFVSPDEFTGGAVDPSTGGPVGIPGPLPYADISIPQSLNKYVYVMNNPLRYTDPDGHCVSGLDTLLCLAAGGFVVHKILEMIELRNSADEASALELYETNLLGRAQSICAKQSPECADSIEAALRAARLRMKKVVKVAISAAGVPGTVLGGPLTTSKVDTAVAGVLEPLMLRFQNSMNSEIEAGRKSSQTSKERPRVKLPDEPMCLKQRDGTCISQ